jgi:superfamily II DNA or RNA helicase
MITFEQNWIYVKCNDTQAKQLDAIWVKSRNAFRLPNTLGALRELYKMGFDTLEAGKQKAFRKAAILELKNMTSSDTEIPGLRPYQQQDIHFLSCLPHAGIFNQQRTGKSPTTLKLVESEGHEKVIIICPASLVLNWRKEIEQWTSYDVYAVNGSKNKRLKTYQEWDSQKGCLVLSKDTCKADYDLINASDCALIVDEAHFLRNYKSNQSKAVFQLGKYAKKRLALTGTPSVNSGSDI